MKSLHIFLLLSACFLLSAMGTQETTNQNYDDLQLEVLQILSPIINERFNLPTSENENLGAFNIRQIRQNKVLCQSCRFIFKYGGHLPTYQMIALFDLVGTTVCTAARIQEFKVCFGAVKEMVPHIVRGLLNRFTNPDLACPKLGFCAPIYQIVNIDQYVHDIVKDKPQKQVIPIPTYEQTFNLLHISDVHTDLEYLEGANTKCGEPLCCRAESGKVKNAQDKAGYFGTLGECDIPERTVDTMLNFIKTKLADKKIEVAIWTGDNTSHDVWHQSQQRNMQNTINLTEKFQLSMPGTTFIPTMGNHESYPVNVYDYQKEREADLNKVFADIWQEWIGPEAATSHREKGFYSTYVSKIGVKIIGINTQACNDMNWLLISDPTDPFGQLEWLRAQLLASENSNTPVYLISHIPNNGCLDEWSRVFAAIVDRFSYIIRGQFYGHTHYETWILFKSHDLFSKTVGVQYVQSSVTTGPTRNPQFRILEIDWETKIPQNYEVYMLNLEKWNNAPNKEQVEWDYFYNFLTHYKIDNMWNLSNMDKLVKGMQQQEDIYSLVHAVRNHTWKGEKSDIAIKHKYWCDTLTLKSEKNKCLGIDENKFKQLLYGQWKQQIENNKLTNE